RPSASARLLAQLLEARPVLVAGAGVEDGTRVAEALHTRHVTRRAVVVEVAGTRVLVGVRARRGGAAGTRGGGGGAPTPALPRPGPRRGGAPATGPCAPSRPATGPWPRGGAPGCA